MIYEVSIIWENPNNNNLKTSLLKHQSEKTHMHSKPDLEGAIAQGHPTMHSTFEPPHT